MRSFEKHWINGLSCQIFYCFILHCRFQLMTWWVLKTTYWKGRFSKFICTKQRFFITLELLNFADQESPELYMQCAVILYFSGVKICNFLKNLKWLPTSCPHLKITASKESNSSNRNWLLILETSFTEVSTAGHLLDDKKN